ncbi:MAG: O-acetyl-ADP-ribose deacetylase [Coriobacteriia bacterium]|nr:O-acetyl-ADP-ribose deacetylase [Coriobacteriia bacterium]
MGAVFQLPDDRSIALERGDLTRVDADAIVNAANSQLARGGGVCGAIHAAGGPSIAEECRAWVAEHGAVPTGGAAITTGGRLPARFVVHAVGPVWHGGSSREPDLLANAYRSSIEIADGQGLCSIAFPSISTGIFGYPVSLAAPVALEAARGALAAAQNVREVRFVLFDQATHDAYEAALESLSVE